MSSSACATIMTRRSDWWNFAPLRIYRLSSRTLSHSYPHACNTNIINLERYVFRYHPVGWMLGMGVVLYIQYKDAMKLMIVISCENRCPGPRFPSTNASAVRDGQSPPELAGCIRPHTVKAPSPKWRGMKLNRCAPILDLSYHPCSAATLARLSRTPMGWSC